jgi:hypothetical protein
MYRVLQSLVAGIRKFVKGRTPTTASRQFRPGVEGMEDRLVLSSTSLLPGLLNLKPVLAGQQLFQKMSPDLGAQLTPAIQIHRPLRLFYPSVSQVNVTKLNSNLIRLLRIRKLFLAVPNFAGVNFDLKSDNPGVNDHELDIQTQTYYASGAATFTGTWSPLGQPQNASFVTNTSMGWDSQGVHVTFAWANGTHTFDGHITAVNGHWHIDGNTNAGPGHVSGDQI